MSIPKKLPVEKNESEFGGTVMVTITIPCNFDPDETRAEIYRRYNAFEGFWRRAYLNGYSEDDTIGKLDAAIAAAERKL